MIHTACPLPMWSKACLFWIISRYLLCRFSRVVWPGPPLPSLLYSFSSSRLMLLDYRSCFLYGEMPLLLGWEPSNDYWCVLSKVYMLLF